MNTQPFSSGRTAKSLLPCHPNVSMATFSSAERLWNESDLLRWDERNESSEASGQDERNYYAMLYSLLILAIVFGNVLVCLAVLRERSLQTTTNYLVVSLAVADLLVASLVMPWAVYLEVSLCIYNLSVQSTFDL